MLHFSARIESSLKNYRSTAVPSMLNGIPMIKNLNLTPTSTKKSLKSLRKLKIELEDEIGSSFGIGELRIDSVSITDLKIVNPDSELEVSIDEITFQDFHLKNGVLQSIGKLLVRSSQLELKTVPSVEFTEIQNTQRFEGVLRADSDHRLHSDVPFAIDFGVDKDFKSSMKLELFNDQMQILETP